MGTTLAILRQAGKTLSEADLLKSEAKIGETLSTIRFKLEKRTSFKGDFFYSNEIITLNFTRIGATY